MKITVAKVETGVSFKNEEGVEFLLEGNDIRYIEWYEGFIAALNKDIEILYLIRTDTMKVFTEYKNVKTIRTSSYGICVDRTQDTGFYFNPDNIPIYIADPSKCHRIQ